MDDIVYVDDEPDLFMIAAAGHKTRFNVQIFDPDAPPLKALPSSWVWLFDFFLVVPAHGGAIDENGLSLFQKWKAGAGGRPTTVVVSSDLERAVGEPVGPIERHHIVAQRHGVEWIGDKSEETVRRVIALADAAAAIGRALMPSAEVQTLGMYEVDRLVFRLLGVPRKAKWANSAQRQIDRARPPREVSVTSTPATARTIVGWLLSHVLPYPSFLVSDAQAALRLQITPASFREIAGAVEKAGSRDKFRDSFWACRYTGPLAAFSGRRWWRAGIDDLAWNLSQAKEGFWSELKRATGGIKVERLEQSEPVLVFDADLVETDEVAEASECVRVTDEDFPANVDAAWVRIITARGNRLLAAKVVYEDLGQLGPPV